MKELRSKRKGTVQIISDLEYAEIVNKGIINLGNFIVTDIQRRAIVPKDIPKEVKRKI